MLSHEGIMHNDKNECFFLTICNHCKNTLTSSRQSHVPKHSLKNSLYHGELPQCFQSLTWVEEQVCACYRSMAYVTHLHYLNDPKHPYVLHGNTCAFEQDVVSTVDRLPRVPSDLEQR